jgi:hypothetical protein
MTAEPPSGGTDPGHPLTRILEDAARGRFPPPDGTVLVLPPPPGRSDAVVAFTAHHVVAADVPPAEVVRRLSPEDLGAPMSPDCLAWLGRRLGSTAGMTDLVLVAFGTREAGRDLHPRRDLHSHPREARSSVPGGGPHVRRLRRAGPGDGRTGPVPSVGGEHRGRAGPPGTRSGPGTRPRRPGPDPGGPASVCPGEPGNVASLRCFLSAGYRPIGSEVLFLRGR